MNAALLRCPGIYCGRELLDDGNWTDCGACPRGFRSNASSACVPCDDMPMFYDWLYLGFMALLALVLHWFFIDMVAMSRNIPKEVIAMHASALFEIVAASLLTLQLTDPVGSFRIRSCKTRRLSDWYTLLHNPTPNYETSLHCTQEAVYPLFVDSDIAIHHGLHLLRSRSADNVGGTADSVKKVLAQARKIFNLRGSVLLSRSGAAARDRRRFDILLVPVHNDHTVGTLERGAFRLQVESDDEVSAPELRLGHQERRRDSRTLALARIRRNGSGHSARRQHSSGDARPRTVARPLLRPYSEVHGSSQTSHRINVASIIVEYACAENEGFCNKTKKNIFLRYSVILFSSYASIDFVVE